MEPTNTKTRWLGVAIAIVLPSLVTWAYFHLLADSDVALQQGTYMVGKVIQFGFPLFWVLVVLRKAVWSAGLVSVEDETSSISKPWTNGRSIAFGIAMGLAVSAAMFVIYRFGFPDSVVETLSSHLVERVSGFSVNTWQKFLGLSLFYAFCHSFMEEYYYRWFVFGQLRHVTKLMPAMVISGFAFMGHHVIVLAHYFGMTLLTAFLSLCIAIGGMIWAWQYEKSKSKSLIGPWLSHLLVDAGIFAIGYSVLSDAGLFK